MKLMAYNERVEFQDHILSHSNILEVGMKDSNKME
jgi:hypothetical protein